MKMSDNSNTRIFLQGNEDVARWHLPVVLSKFKAFVRRCKEAGLKQDRFTMFFEDTGTSVFGQYFYGEESVQLYSPLRSTVIREESKDDFSMEGGPKTFWVNTTQGYFWVEVRYDAGGSPVVILTPFEAVVDGEFVYPGFALASPGMIAGCLDGTPATRYVLAQNGGVLASTGNEKGTIKSTAIIDNGARITVVANIAGLHEYVLMLSSGGKTAEIRRVSISFYADNFVIDRQYASIDMAAEGEANIVVSNLLANPTWLHRKCSGSYFSPNKTIGYHVDIGTDDAFLGNIMSVAGADLLDNTGGFEEALFNHTPDLYRVAGMLSFPVSVNGPELKVILVSPTMGFSGTPEDKCWGGYGLTQTWANCVDYMQDFGAWLLSPRFVVATINMDTGEKSYADPASAGGASMSMSVLSWDGAFSCRFIYDVEYSCDTDFYSEMYAQEGEQCSWTESCSGTCDTGDPGYTGDCPKGWTPTKYWEYFSRENLRLSRRAWFIFGEQDPSTMSPQNTNGFYLLFDGMWHLDIGVLWTRSRVVGNGCVLCMLPYGSQDPGQNVIFAIGSGDREWIKANGHEYVENMEIVTPLSDIAWPLGGTVLGFVAKVPEEYAAPHEPVLMRGGVEFPAENVEGETVNCERAIMSSPCICAGNEMALDPLSSFEIDSSGIVRVTNGCAPFEWSSHGASFDSGKSYVLTDQREFSVTVTDDCIASIQVQDACGTSVEMSDEYSVVGAVTGESYLAAGESGYYTHNLGAGATYTGSLQVVSSSGSGAILKMPEGASSSTEYTASWSGKCASTASMVVTALPPCELPYDVAAYMGVWYSGGAPAIPGGYVRIPDYPYNTGDCVFTVGSFRDDYRWTTETMAVGSWRVAFAPMIGTLIDICIGIYPGSDHDPHFYSYFLVDERRC